MQFPTLTVVIGTLVSLCSCGPLILPAPRQARLEPRSATHPIERLGRWHDGEFIAVTEDSVPASHLHVIVHGWAPGWANEVISDPSVRSWEAEDERGREFEPWVGELASTIVEHDPHAVVLTYSWLDHAATSRSIYAQRRAFRYTQLHGRTLAEALARARSDDFREVGGRMHFIGHSYGARVATVAAVIMDDKPRQLTIFDSPDSTMTMVTGGQNHLWSLLAKLPIGQDEGEIFVDNYVAMVGDRYRGESTAGVVDVALNPPYSTLAFRSRHLYPMEFYRRSAGQSFGMGWSPFFHGQPPDPGCYEQPYGEIALQAGCRPDGASASP